MDIDKKRKYILSISSSIIYTAEIRNLIDKNSVKITENSNGIFINLSLLNDDIIDEFYSIIIKQKEKNNNYQIIEEENIKIISKKITKKVENKKFKIIKLTRLQRQILKSIL